MAHKELKVAPDAPEHKHELEFSFSFVSEEALISERARDNTKAILSFQATVVVVVVVFGSTFSQLTRVWFSSVRLIVCSPSL